ncbi:hypothetical protein EMIHUDRAFT_359327 [Emiliania huxleyi CCMP1516]|uniref:Ankyrin repeat protein n=2 Tax=Emiliania huxleyi TaxID=2903 RepID=A0A0D3I6M7_EMIH1|nr:hypothetical protein EMIHUDRAFT_359327 [Emiliania huxleyi CCMP1516]EOD06912.1 hypothetical protein EMIHUDRAFT_359327 [Emiliania huxleyi CCMP1516]|eukprot:XP_005759341.1 hypothetical protein EMIHUDRAFT_359327 [Emiliania huxleyi CCMP1516]
MACQNGHLEVARLLLEAGGAVNQAKEDGATPLYIACERGQLECVQLLLEAGAADNEADEDGATPLFIASLNGHLECVRLLLEARAAIRGWTPLAHLETLTAARTNSLLRSGASLHEGEPTPLRRAAGGEGEAAALVRRAAAPWSPASHSLFPAAARARAALLVLSLYEIHERYHLDSAGTTNGIAALDFGHCVLGFAIARETE